MKNSYILFFFVMISISCSNSKEEEVKFNNYNRGEIDQLISNHLTNTITVFQDSIDNQKGFLGYKNIRDYIGLGEEKFEDRVLRTWNKVYTNKVLEKKIETHLKTNKSIDVEVNNANKFIGMYIHKISLSLVVLVVEGFFEFLLDLFFGYTFAAVVVSIFVFYQFTYGGWIRMSKGRSERIQLISIRTFRWVTYSMFIISIIVGLYTGDYSDNALKEKIKTNIKQDIFFQIENKLK